MKIIDCVCSKLCHFHSRGGFPDGRLVCNAHFHTLLDSCRNKPLLFISLAAPLLNEPMYISRNPHIRTHKSFWHLLCYAFFFSLMLLWMLSTKIRGKKKLKAGTIITYNQWKPSFQSLNARGVNEHLRLVLITAI